MLKFGRNYLLQIQTQTGQLITIQPPFTVEFDITRNTLSSANVCSLRIYNLSSPHRNQIRHNYLDTQTFQSIIFQAGYGQNLATAFVGNITQAWSVREGTNFVTTIESFDGGFAFNNAKVNYSFPAGTTKLSVINSVIGTMPFVTAGAIGAYPGTLDRGNAVSGNSTNILGDLTGGGFFIDGGKVNCLGNNECVTGGVPRNKAL